jgi:hypothetical protein
LGYPLSLEISGSVSLESNRRPLRDARPSQPGPEHGSTVYRYLKKPVDEWRKQGTGDPAPRDLVAT